MEQEIETPHRRREKVLPDWPQAMRRKLAAQYVDLSEAGFEREINAGRLPGPIVMDKKERWLRPALDKALEHISNGYEGGMAPWEREFYARTKAL